MQKIFYFTGTGNSLYIAKKIAAKSNYELCEISYALSNRDLLNCADTEVIGLVFPLYSFGVPEMVERFLKSLHNLNSKTYVFAIISCGSSGYGIVSEQLSELLSHKNSSLNYVTFQHMPSNYIKLFKPPTLEMAKHDIQTQDAFIEQIIADISHKRSKIITKSIFSPIYQFIYKGWRKQLENCAQKFSVQTTCIGCALCVKLCPEQNISLINAKPKWANNCQDCLACINACPTNSIQANIFTKIYGRYLNPYIKINDLEKHF